MCIKLKKHLLIYICKCLITLWEHTGSNRGPSACKADALNQLSYAPFIFRSANIRDEWYSKKFKSYKTFDKKMLQSLLSFILGLLYTLFTLLHFDGFCNNGIFIWSNFITVFHSIRFCEFSTEV